MDNDLDTFDEKARKQVEEIWRIQRAINLSMQESDLRRQESDRKMEAAYQESDLRRQESDRKMKEACQKSDLRKQESDRKMKEAYQRLEVTERIVDKTALEIEQVNRQMGEWGNKWGGFTEGMAYPSMVKVLTEQFQLDQFAPNLQSCRGGGVLEIDVLGYANGDINRACIVEVKSRLRERGIEQILRILDKFSQFFPEHKGKTVYGILAAVHVPDDLARQVIKEGLFLARISDDTFQLNVPDGFQPKTWGQPDDQLFVREAAPIYQLPGK